MNIIKGIGLFIIGAIFGYGLTYTEKSMQIEPLISEDIASEQTLPVEASQELKDSPLVNVHPKLDDVKKVNKNNSNIDISLLNEEDQKQVLMDNYFALQKKYLKSKSKIVSLQHQLAELDESDVTDEEMENLVPKPFKSFLSSFRGDTRNDIFDFHNQEDDLDWGYDQQNNISDYVQTHYEGTSVELISVICKQPRCEVLVTEKQEDAWNKIMKDMTQQAWWKFSSFTSSTRSNAENELSIYAFLSQ